MTELQNDANEAALLRQQVSAMRAENYFLRYQSMYDAGCAGAWPRTAFDFDSRFKRENVLLNQRVGMLQLKLELCEQQKAQALDELNKVRMALQNMYRDLESASTQTDLYGFSEYTVAHCDSRTYSSADKVSASETVQNEHGASADYAMTTELFKLLNERLQQIEQQYANINLDAIQQLRYQEAAIEMLNRRNSALQEKYEKANAARRSLYSQGFVISASCVAFESEHESSSVSYYDDASD